MFWSQEERHEADDSVGGLGSVGVVPVLLVVLFLETPFVSNEVDLLPLPLKLLIFLRVVPTESIFTGILSPLKILLFSNILMVLDHFC